MSDVTQTRRCSISPVMEWWSETVLRTYLKSWKCAGPLALNLYQNGTGITGTGLY